MDRKDRKSASYGQTVIDISERFLNCSLADRDIYTVAVG